ncbi:MAG: hypothetical protein IKG30_09155 [Clostridiales bacterium]|nr:hypothetical protein [Clostridiales bacterium]
MADDLKNKMEPEISEAAEVIKEDAAVVKAAKEVKEKKAEAAATKEAAKEAEAAAKDAAKEAKKAEEAAAKEAKKAEEQAAKEAKKAEEQAAKDAAKKQAALEKEQEKAKAAKEKAEAKLEKKRQKRAAQQALIDACPPQYRPVSTSKYFWLAFLSAIPCIGFIATLLLAIAGRNRNVKNFEKAILAYYIIGIVIGLIAIIVVGMLIPAEIRENIIMSLGKIFNSVSIG